jgi:hypothetical protein
MLFQKKIVNYGTLSLYWFLLYSLCENVATPKKIEVGKYSFENGDIYCSFSFFWGDHYLFS